MTAVFDKESLGDWTNLKGTRYHLVYALWLLLRNSVRDVRFFSGNDLLVQPIRPPSDVLAAGSAISVYSVLSDIDSDLWIQLKATAADWTLTSLLHDNLLFNFICNAAVSESQHRKWRVELVTESDIRGAAIRSFASSSRKNPKANQRFKAIIRSAQRHLKCYSITRSVSDLTDIGHKVLLTLSSKDRVAFATLKSEVETAIMSAAPDWAAVRRIASTLVGAMLIDAAASPREVRVYTAQWVNKEAGLNLISDYPFDVDPVAACDRAVNDVIRPDGSLPFQESRFVCRDSLCTAVRQFLDAPEPVFVLTGRSGTGKSWSIGDLMRNVFRGQARIFRSGAELTIGTSLVQMANDSLGKYSGRNERSGVFTRLSAVARAGLNSRLLFCVDDPAVSATSAAQAREWLAALAREARDNDVKLLLSCQDETWNLLRLHERIRTSDIFNPRRVLNEGPVTYSFRLDDFLPEELEAALSKRLPPEHATRAFLHLRGSAFLPVRHPFVFELYLEQHCHILSAPASRPDPIAVDDLLAAAIERRLNRVATILLTDKESVEAAFREVVSRLWEGRHFAVSTSDLVNGIAKHLPERGTETLQELRANGLLTSTGPPRWVDGTIGDYLYARLLMDQSANLSELVSTLQPDQDSTVVEIYIRMAENGPALAEHLLCRDRRWRSAVARGLSQRSPNEAITVAIVAGLTRPGDDGIVDLDGCEALGILAARGRGSVLHRHAWRRAIEMYVSEDLHECVRGIRSLATALEFEPELVCRLVKRRVRSLVNATDNETRAELGQKLDDALSALQNVNHRSAAEAVRGVLQTVSSYECDERIQKREEFLETVDYLRGKISPFLEPEHAALLFRELSSGDRVVRLRAAQAIRPAVFNSPDRFRKDVLQAIRVEEDPDVLLRILWAAPRLTRDVSDLLDAFSARRTAAWSHPLPCGPAFAILGEAADIDPEHVSKILPARLSYIPQGWIRACLSDVHALAWWRCARKQTSLRWHLQQLADPCLTQIPHAFHIFAIRGALIARLGLATLDRSQPAVLNVSMTSHRDGHMPYCHSELEDFIVQHASTIAQAPDLPGIIDLFVRCISSFKGSRLPRGHRRLENMHFLCARNSLDELCILAKYLQDPVSIMSRLPRDWQAIRAARLLLASNHSAAGVTKFAQDACDEHARSGSAQALYERSICLAHLSAKRPDPASEMNSTNDSHNSFEGLFGRNDDVDKMSLLIDRHSPRLLELLDRAVASATSFPILYFWHGKACEWKSQLLARVHYRMFDPQPISPASAVRLVLDSLTAFRSARPSQARDDFIAVFEGIHTWLTGRRVRVNVVGSSNSPFGIANRAAAELMTRFAETPLMQDGRSCKDLLLGFVMDSSLWWQSYSYRWANRGLQTGAGVSYYALATFPSIRLAAVAISKQCVEGDIVSKLMTERYRVFSEMANIDWQFTHRAETIDDLGRWLDLVQKVRVGLPDERVMLRLGNLFLRLGRYEEAESWLQNAVSHHLCSDQDRAKANYDLACVAAKTGQPDRCRAMVERAIMLMPGYRNEISADSDFDSVRNTDWYDVVVKRPFAEASDQSD